MALHSKRACAMLTLAGAMLLAACGEKGAQAPEATGAGATAPEGEAKATAAGGPADRVVVTYFHGTRRCPTCLGIQQTINETVEGRFAAEIAAGELEFREIDYDLDEHRHFAEEFQLSFSTMIVALASGDRTLKWENCDKVWEHAHDHTALGTYVEERIRAHLALLRKG
jgi:hypothetical protein